MGLTEDLDRLVTYTGHRRYREWCDPAHPAYRPGAAAGVSRLARLVPAPPPPRRPCDIILRGHTTSWTGYGQILEHVGRALEALGARVGVIDTGADPRYLPVRPWVTERLGDDPTAPVIQVSLPHLAPLPGRRTLALTMWETDRVNAVAVRALNACAAVITPCAHNAAAFRASGVTAPVSVVPLGVAAEEGYSPRPMPTGPFTFAMAARMAHGGVRKGLNEGIRAFVEAFPDEDVRLLIKVWSDCVPALRVPDDPRVEVVSAPFTPRQMADWHERFDVLFVPSKGEGWGLHSLQAMACGRPLVAAYHAGTAAFWHPGLGWPLDFDMVPAGEFYSGQGRWAVPRHESMVAALRAAYAAGRDSAREIGLRAASRARAFPWSRTGAGVLAALRAHGLFGAPAPSPDDAWRPCPARDDSCRCPARECGDPARGAAFGRPVAVTVPGILPRRAYAVTAADCARCPGPAP